jgi:hypothetical protein
VRQFPDARLPGSGTAPDDPFLIQIGFPVGEDFLDRRLNDLALLDEHEVLLAAAFDLSQAVVTNLLLHLVLLVSPLLTFTSPSTTLWTITIGCLPPPHLGKP